MKVYLSVLDCFDYFEQYMISKTQILMKGIGGRLEHKPRREKQQIECKDNGYKFQSRRRSIAGCHFLLRTLRGGGTLISK